MIFNAFFSHFFKKSACFLYLYVVYWLYKMRKDKNTMKNFISATLIFLGIAMMAGSAGDCDGKCVENANSLLEMFMYALGGLALMISGGFLILKTQ
ncbi:MAG: hypothetical protein CMP36_04385 [Rickettsiales bacterium]|nr:hypothetical protein [Rickettsiales bacterium]